MAKDRIQWRSYYRAVRRRALSNFGVHVREQLLVSLLTGALAGVLAWFAEAGASSLVYGLAGFAVWIASAAGYYGLRAPIELQADSDTERERATEALDSLRQEQDRLRAIDIDVLSAGSTVVEYHPLRPEVAQVMVSMLVYNHGEGANFTASMVDQSVKGLGDAYPIGSFPLRWQEPNDGTHQWIGRGGDGRLDVAFVWPVRGTLRFLGPGVEWAMRFRMAETILGLIDVSIAGRDARQRVRFTMSVGPTHPVNFTELEKVAHD